MINLFKDSLPFFNMPKSKLEEPIQPPVQEKKSPDPSIDPFMLVYNHDFDGLSMWINDGGDINIKSEKTQMSLLYLAIHKDCEDIIDLLINNKIDINAQNINGNTALHLTVYKEYTYRAALLIAYGADRNIKNYDKMRPCDLKDYMGKTMSRLLANGETDKLVFQFNTKRFYHACKSFDLNKAQLLIDMGYNPNTKGKLGRTILHYLANHKHLCNDEKFDKLLEFLILGNKVNCAIEDENNDASIVIAMKTGNISYIRAYNELFAK